MNRQSSLLVTGVAALGTLLAGCEHRGAEKPDIRIHPVDGPMCTVANRGEEELNQTYHTPYANAGRTGYVTKAAEDFRAACARPENQKVCSLQSASLMLERGWGVTFTSKPDTCARAVQVRDAVEDILFRASQGDPICVRFGVEEWARFNAAKEIAHHFMEAHSCGRR